MITQQMDSEPSYVEELDLSGSRELGINWWFFVDFFFFGFFFIIFLKFWFEKHKTIKFLPP